MANLKEVKQRITSVSSTQQITKAMKMVAAAKLRKAQDKILKMRPFSKKLTAILNDVVSSMGGELQVAYAEQREVQNVLLVSMTSDKGLCGAFNSNVMKMTNSLMEGEFKGKNITILPLGKKSYEFYSKRGFNVIPDYFEIFNNITFDTVRAIANFVMDGYTSKKFDKVVLVYNHFRNVATQDVTVEHFLPMGSLASSTPGTENRHTDYILEPSKEFIVQELVPSALKTQFYKAILESNASEHGARMTSMDKATENANDLLKELKLLYNRSRQASITGEILEIVAGANALEGT
ncbi:ATP synthase F1 subunit gamma [Shivajiella indica]|uniref:ATP synthase gamma chain n=1 Tax=Shivajiella indica TaxID=872115 RepID=A0ABW5B1T9_9BACT